MHLEKQLRGAGLGARAISALITAGARNMADCYELANSASGMQQIRRQKNVGTKSLDQIVMAFRDRERVDDLKARIKELEGELMRLRYELRMMEA